MPRHKPDSWLPVAQAVADTDPETFKTADEDTYRAVIGWARQAQAAWQRAHPKPKPPTSGPCSHPLSRRVKGLCTACGATVSVRTPPGPR